MGVGEGSRGEDGWVEGQGGACGGGCGRCVLGVKQGLYFVADPGVDVAVLEEGMEGPRQGLRGRVAAWCDVESNRVSLVSSSG